MCLTCNQEVDAAELKNFNSHSVEIWVSHHGAEDWTTVKFPFRIDVEDPIKSERANSFIRRAMGDFRGFDPTRPPK
jgi:hypothetical protein